MSNFNLFRNEVLSLYHEKRKRNELPSKLCEPSPANLRDYSLVVLRSNLSDDDKRIMEEFYNDAKAYESLEMAIRKVDIGKLKSLQNFITERTKNPDELLVKLLAVLVDYQPRPFVWEEWRPKEEREKRDHMVESDDLVEGDDLINGKAPEEGEPSAYGDGSEEDLEVNNIKGGFTGEATTGTGLIPLGIMSPAPPDKVNWLSKKRLYLISTTAGIVLLFIGWMYMKPNQCMCWVDDHYVEVDCAAQTNPLGPKKIALNYEKLNSFKKIMRPDTLSVKHVNRVWYSKIDHDVEFFTSSGFHPEHPTRSLKAATEHILTKYAGDSVRVEFQNNGN
ncbi:hypothetical protein SAMN05660841_04104 [Sphingobacterium nematocida]|uniref:Uncharacterized protein n=1 Tax=Sphingobacterium nematocida TaxID=1513896 RepID=A0A1T5GIA6_9SPHI|nr:hypothetical protein [Sphingobacterium nematocida]SKC08184.1 hypothetical protein SAMN05660841_04104 [Sphingobacterium nematocida]